MLDYFGAGCFRSLDNVTRDRGDLLDKPLHLGAEAG